MNEMNTNKKIYLCSSDLKAEKVAQDVGIFFGVDAVKLTDDPCVLRGTIAQSDAANLIVIDSIQGSMDARNIASALLADGHNVCLLEDGNIAAFDSLKRYESNGLQIINRGEIIRDSEKNQSRPVREIEIPEEEYSWDKLRSSLKTITGKYSNTFTNQAFDELDEVDGISPAVDKEKEKVSVASPLIDKNDLRGKSIAFCSGRGGVGKTTLISTAGMLASSWGLKVVMLDLDLFCGNLYMHYGQPSIASLTSIKNGGGNITKLISEYMQRVSATSELFLYGSLDHPEESELVGPLYEQLLNGLLHNFDLVLIDMPTTWNEYDVRLLRQVDRVVVVADERASSVSSMIRTMNLANRLGVVRTKMIRLINRCDSYGFDQKFIQKAEEGSYCPHTYYVEDGGRPIAEMLSRGKASEVLQIRNSFTRTWSEGLRNILKDMGYSLGTEGVVERKGSLFTSLLSLFSGQKSPALEEV